VPCHCLHPFGCNHDGGEGSSLNTRINCKGLVDCVLHLRVFDAFTLLIKQNGLLKRSRLLRKPQLHPYSRRRRNGRARRCGPPFREPALTVGILEAGPVAVDEPKINVPGRLAETLFTKYDWQFETTPQPGLNGRKLSWNRGKVLGGSSALNYMMWCRGSRDDYDNWEKLGNEGWGWKGMLSVYSPCSVRSSSRGFNAVTS
jgi:GMC oxidoreductase